MLDRIIGAFTFRSGVYAEVEKDEAFTTTAWILVIVVAFLSQLGATASTNLVNWLIGAVVMTILAVIGFAVGAFVIQWVGQVVFSAKVNFGEMVRTLGLANVWQIVGLVGVLGAFTPALACLLFPARVVAALLGLIAWFVAAKEALDLEWIPTIVTVIIGWIVIGVVTVVVGGIVLGALGLGAAALGGLTPPAI